MAVGVATRHHIVLLVPNNIVLKRRGRAVSCIQEIVMFNLSSLNSVSHGSSHHVGHCVPHSGSPRTSHQVSPNHTSLGVSHQQLTPNHTSLKNVCHGVSHHASLIISDHAIPSVSQYVSPNVSHNEGLDNMDMDDHYFEEESSQHNEQVCNLKATVERQQQKKMKNNERALAEKATIAVEEQKVLGERQLNEMEDTYAAFIAMMLKNYPPPS